MPDYGVGGAQRVFSDQSKFLSTHFDVSIATFNNDYVDAYGSVGKKMVLGVKAGSNAITKMCFFFLRVWRLRKIKKGFDFCISHLEGADFVNVLSKRNEKIICCIHGTKFHDGEIKGWLGWLRKKILMPFLYKRADLIVAVSSAIRTELIMQLAIPETNVKIITNGFEIKDIEEKSREPISSRWKALFDNNLTICLCARLAPQKNQQSFLPIFSYVKQSINCKLIIIGDGELRKKLIEQSNTLGLSVYVVGEDQIFSEQFDVYFFGDQLNPFPLISRTSIFALPSAWEGFPLALCEAMICRVPVIAADCPTGPREILAVDEDSESIYGVLLPIPTEKRNQNFYSWAEAVSMLLTNRQKADEYILNARQRVTEFSMDKMETAWVKAIQSVS
ncbi:MAG: glycosyltransferase [Cyclobacteriaceae bacterium]